MDAACPLAWDVGWVTVFGLVPLALGVWPRPRVGDGDRGGGRRAGLERWPGRAGDHADALGPARLVAAKHLVQHPPIESFRGVEVVRRVCSMGTMGEHADRVARVRIGLTVVTTPIQDTPQRVPSPHPKRTTRASPEVAGFC